MLFEDTYKTISWGGEGVFRDKGSKFIAYAYPVRSDEDVKEYVRQLKLIHPKARHFCCALRLTKDRSVFRVNDDGEPSGSAGRPILSSLLSNDLTDVVIIVVRYFGGTLLGVPGLINAYKTAAVEAIANSEIIEKTLNSIYEIRFEHIHMNDVMRIVKEEDLTIRKQVFDLQCSFEIEVRNSILNRVLERLSKAGISKPTFLR